MQARAKKAQVLVANLGRDVTALARAAMIAPVLEEMIDEYEGGRCKDGVHDVQQWIIELIFAAILASARWFDPERVGVHPANREGAGLVPVDVHDLLFQIVMTGWSWTECKLFACEIPPTDEGAFLRKENRRIIDGSGGLLANLDVNLLDIVTARGSHTTAAVNCMQFGTTGIHPELCHDGNISKSLIIDGKPSMAEPFQKGMQYTTVKWELVAACPKLMPFLSRSGNASHGVERTQTALQACKRIHSIVLSSFHGVVKPDWDEVAKIPSVGMGPKYFDIAKCYGKFVK